MSSRDTPRMSGRLRSRRLMLEGLEDRLAPALVGLAEAPVAIRGGNEGPGSGGYTPAQIRTAYGINSLSLDGTGQTIAILGLYNNPDLLTDLDTFDKAFGTTATGQTLYQQYGSAKSFVTIYNQNGKTSPLPGPDPNDTTESEEVLDVEWAHAIAPGAKIDFVEGNTDSDADAEAATITAAGLPGVTVFSASYSDQSESSSELVQDSDYKGAGVTYLVASGDNGAFDTGPPAFSPYVVAVGGTSLSVNADSTYQSETGWGSGSRSRSRGGSGGGVSQYESEPAYQQSVQITGARTIPDVAFNADPNTGVAVVDSYDDSFDPFTVFGGTSVAAPSWAGLIAIADQGRAAAGEHSLDYSDPTQTLEALYSLPDADYHDNLGGSNGTSTAGLLNVARYNEVTGLGSPIAPNVVADLIAYGGPIGLSQSSLPGGAVHSTYDQSITANGGNGAKTLTYSVTSGSIPAGLSFQAGASELDITGTPTADGSVTFSVTATDSAGASISQSFTLTIGSGLALTAAGLPDGTIESAYNQTIAATGGVGNKTLTVDNITGTIPGLILPAGGTNSLIIAGTPTALGTVAFTVTATDSIGNTTSANYSITIDPGPASTVVIVTGPQTLTAGSASGIVTVQLEDAGGNVVSAGSSGVTFSLASTSSAGMFLDAAGQPLSSPSITVTDGPATASFEYEDTTAGMPLLTVSVAGFSATQQETVAPAAASALAVTTAPVRVSVGQSSSILTVELQDPYGNTVPAGNGGVTVDLATSSGTGTYLDSTGVPLVSGVLVIGAGSDSAGFEYEDTAAGMPTLSLTASGLTGATQQETVAAQPANHLMIATPGQVIGGGAFSVTVYAEDSFGNIDDSFAGSIGVGLSAGPPGGKLSGSTLVSVQNGVGTLAGLSLNLPGDGYTLFAASTGDLLVGVSGPITVSPTTHFLVSGIPAHPVAGIAFTVTVTAEDSFNHVDPSYRGTIRLTSSDHSAVFQGGNTLAFTTDDNGQATVTVTLKTAGNQKISVADMTTSTVGGVSPAIAVSAASVAGLSVTGSPTAVAASAYRFKVTAVDSFGNTVSSYRGTVFLASDNAGVLPSQYTFTSGDAGSHSFSATLLDVGSDSLTADDPVNSVSGSDEDIIVMSAATHLGVSVLSTRTPAGQVLTLTVAPLIGQNTLDTQFTDLLHFKSSDPKAALPADVPFSPDFTGTETFTFTLDSAGSQTITVSDLTRSAIAGKSPAITVTAGNVVGLTLTGASSAVSGSPYTLTATAVDSFGNVVPGYRGTLFFSSGKPAQLPAYYVFTSADLGSHRFSVTPLGVGTYTLTARDPINNLSASDSNIAVVSATTHLGVSVLSTRTTAGQMLTLTISPLTAQNGLDMQFTDLLHFKSSDPKAVLPADIAFSPDYTGTETFVFTLETAGNQTIAVSDLTRSAIFGISPVVTVNSVKAVKVSVTGYPATALAGVSYPFTVTLLDTYGNQATGYLGTLSLSGSGASVTPSTWSFKPGDRGSHTFTATFASPGSTESLTATDSVNHLSGSQSKIDITTLTPQVDGPSVGVRGQPLAYSLSADEPGVAASTIFTYRIDWDGNGSIDQIVKGPAGGLTVMHSYPTTGTYTVKVSVIDPAIGQSTQPATHTTPIEATAMETDPYDSGETALAVGGTTGNDVITISPADAAGQTVVVYINGVLQPGGPFAPTGHILVYGQAGNDTIQEVPTTIGNQTWTIAVPALLDGGTGNNTLSASGSNADNVLIGGAGSNNLTGGGQGDILIGGGGPATLFAGTGDDVLVSGSTSFDDNADALLALLAEWGRSDLGYVQRVQDLFAGGGLNGLTVLDPATVSGDSAASQLIDPGGSDWLWITLGGKSGDTIGGLSVGEVATIRTR